MVSPVSPETFNATVFAPGYWGSGGVDDLGDYAGGTAGTVRATLTGTLTEVGDTVTAVIGGHALTLRAYSDIPGGVLFTTLDFATFYVFLTVPFRSTTQYQISYTVAGNSGLACFLAGTRIATDRGEVAVEALRVDDRVVALRSGGFAAVRWIGRRRVAGRRATDPRHWPIRIQAGAFAPERPRRDLLLSSDHAIYAAGGLIPVRYLVNGATVAPQPATALDYWHLELAEHDLVLAEGLAAESYLDTGNRGAFEGQAPSFAAPALARRVWAARACAPLLLDPAAQAPARRHLLARAAELGWRATEDAGLALRCDGAPLAADRDGGTLRAILPPGAHRLVLASRSAVPAEMFADSTDTRRLGVAVARLAIDGGAIAPDDLQCTEGWYDPEPDLHWTNGEGVLLLPPSAQPRALELTAVPLLRYWLPRDVELSKAA
jgi:hypothetical protein